MMPLTACQVEDEERVVDISALLGLDFEANPRHRLAKDLLDADNELLDSLVRCRAASRLSQGEVGARMGISQSAVAKIESGERNPHLSTIRRYALAVGAQVRHVVVPVDLSTYGASQKVEVLDVGPTQVQTIVQVASNVRFGNARVLDIELPA